jgi:hypothetical protein
MTTATVDGDDLWNGESVAHVSQPDELPIAPSAPLVPVIEIQQGQWT